MKKRAIMAILSLILSCLIIFSSCNKIVITDTAETSGSEDAHQSETRLEDESEGGNSTEIKDDVNNKDNSSETTGDNNGSTDNKVETDSGSTDDKGESDSGDNSNPQPEIINGAISAEIVNKNGAKGVLTLTSDDGDQRTADFFYTTVAPKYSSFKITVALPTYKVATLGVTNNGEEYIMNASGGYSVKMVDNTYNTQISGSVLKKSSYTTVRDFWKKVTDTGRIEIASHSHTHGPWPATDKLVVDSGSVIWPKGSAIKELRASAQIIRNALKQETPFIMRPGGSFMTTEVSTYFKSLFDTDTTYLGMRGSNGAPPFKGVTEVNQTKLNTVKKFTTKNGRLTIATVLVRAYEAAYNSSGTGFATTSSSSRATILKAGVSAWEQYVDYAMEYGQWAAIGFHSVVPDTATASGYEVYDSQVMALMDYVQPLVDSGDLWLAHFSEAAKYYFEWSSASVSAVCHNSEYIEVSLTDKETDERFDEALTVKLKVPQHWETAKLTTDGKTTSLTIHTDSDGSHFVYANIVPSDNISTVRP